MLKIGMIGAGFVAGFHARALGSVRGAELAGVSAPKTGWEIRRSMRRRRSFARPSM